MKEKADHIESACPKCHSNTVKECNEAEHTVKEKLLRLVRYDECLKEILSQKETEEDLASKLKRIFDIAEAALVPTVICLSCKELTTKSPCQHCGADLLN